MAEWLGMQDERFVDGIETLRDAFMLYNIVKLNKGLLGEFADQWTTDRLYWAIGYNPWTTKPSRSTDIAIYFK